MSNRLFVGNVSPRVTEDELQQFFSDAGEVLSISIPLDRETSSPRGFAFVEFSRSSEAQRAVEELDGTPLDGRKVRLRPAIEKGASQSKRAQQRRPDRRLLDDYEALEDRESERGREDDYSRSKRSGRERKGGKHGSDRRRRHGTRRFLE